VVPSTNKYLYIASFGTNTIERYEEDSGAAAPAASQTGATFVAHNSGGLNHPLGVLISPVDHNLLVSSLETNEVLEYDINSGDFLSAFVPSDAGLSNPAGLIFTPGRDLLVTNADPAVSNVFRFNGATGEFIDVFAQLDTMGGATSMVFGPDGKLYVGTRFSNGVVRCDASGCEQFVQPDAGGLNRTGGFVFGPDGDFYVASETTNNILHFDGVTGEFINEFVTSGSGGLNRPAGILFGPGGDLYVCSASSNSILHYNGATGAFINAFVTQHDDQIISGPRGQLFGNTNATTLNYVPHRTGSSPGGGGTQGRFAYLTVSSMNNQLRAPTIRDVGPTSGQTVDRLALLIPIYTEPVQEESITVNPIRTRVWGESSGVWNNVGIDLLAEVSQFGGATLA
jgi:DNA-binding beta-propeller fold protein YncE